MIYLYKQTTESFLHFARILFSRNFEHAKFRENKTLAKISEFTVCNVTPIVKLIAICFNSSLKNTLVY